MKNGNGTYWNGGMILRNVEDSDWIEALLVMKVFGDGLPTNQSVIPLRVAVSVHVHDVPDNVKQQSANGY